MQREARAGDVNYQLLNVPRARHGVPLVAQPAGAEGEQIAGLLVHRCELDFYADAGVNFVGGGRSDRMTVLPPRHPSCGFRQV
jgi:hypothetical protein